MKKILIILVQLVVDVAIGALILCGFAYFHHVRSTVGELGTEVPRTEQTGIPILNADTWDANNIPEGDFKFIGNDGEEYIISGEWYEKFKDRFSADIEKTESTYKSPFMSFEITEHRNKENNCTYYVADIYVSSIDCLKNFFADNTYGENITAEGLDMYEQSGAVLLINGDYYGARYGRSPVIRNGVLYNGNVITNQDVCVLYYDGTMKTYLGARFDITKAVGDGAYQAWAFGPSLLDENGKALTEYPSWYSKIGNNNPRTAIGYYEPGHYVMVAIDGRTDISKGMTFIEMSELFEELGCKVAYNLDGGISSFMVYDNDYVNIAPVEKFPGSPRPISDCIIIKDPFGKEG